MIARAAAGLALAALIAAGARRARSLSATGAIAAVAVGTVCVAAGWSWGVLLIAFFVSGTALTRLGAAAKQRRTGGVVAKGGERDAAQVFANGGLFACAAGLSLLAAPEGWMAFGAGSLAAAAGDTWATEIGLLAGAEPRMLTTWRRVPAGTSGGVTLPGLAATVAGAGFVAALALALGWPHRVAVAALAGGVVGAMTDSLAGALLQVRRRCPRCAEDTEQLVHQCGTPTDVVGGLAWMDNDAVNVLCVAVGGLVAAGGSWLAR